jgi:hypothetical protein
MELDAQLSPIRPGPLPAVPVPARLTANVLATLSESLTAELVTTSVPEALRNSSGEKLTFTTYVAPAANVSGVSLPLSREKESPEVTTFEIWTGAVLWLMSDTAEIIVCPMGTAAKVTVFGAATSSCVFADAVFTVGPAQPPRAKGNPIKGATGNRIAATRCANPGRSRTLSERSIGDESLGTRLSMALRC